MEHSKEVLDWARRKWAEADDLEKKNWEVVFPELKESEDERIRQALLTKFVEEKNQGAKYSIHGCSLGSIIAYLEKQKDFQFGYPGIYFYDGEKLHFQGNPAMEEKQKEQKLAKWSEEDTDMFEKLMSLVGEACIAKIIDKDTHDQLKIWIRRIYQILYRHAQEWSEEDLQHKSWILECLADGERKMPEYAEDFRAAYNWLKSLRPQPHWKPREEQMKAMEEVRTIFHHHHLWDEINPILYDYEELMRDLYKLL